MGMDLCGTKGGYCRWSGGMWGEVLDRAEDAGWEPMGTGAPRGVLKADWAANSYGSNEGQLVYARDAKAIADALETTLADLPADQQAMYREFIAFCREGSFRVY